MSLWFVSFSFKPSRFQLIVDPTCFEQEIGLKTYRGPFCSEQILSVWSVSVNTFLKFFLWCIPFSSLLKERDRNSPPIAINSLHNANSSLIYRTNIQHRREIHLSVCLNSDMSGYHDEQENCLFYWSVYSILGGSSRDVSVTWRFMHLR